MCFIIITLSTYEMPLLLAPQCIFYYFSKVFLAIAAIKVFEMPSSLAMFHAFVLEHISAFMANIRTVIRQS